MAGRFEYVQAEEIRDAFARHGVRYLFLGKSGAILLGFPDTTQDADVFVERSEQGGDKPRQRRRVTAAPAEFPRLLAGEQGQMTCNPP
jgi:hypothetical protein